MRSEALSHLALGGLVSFLAACGPSTQETATTASGAPPGSTRFLLDEPLVPREGAPWALPLGAHLEGSRLWMAAGPVSALDWEPLPTDPEFERARLRGVLAPVEGAFVHAAGAAITREGLRDTAAQQRWPEEGQFLLRGQELLRRAGTAHTPQLVSYPAPHEPLTSVLARLEEGRLAPRYVRLINGSRRAIVAPAPVSFGYQVEIPVGGRLEFAIGAMRHSLRTEPAGVSLVPLEEAGASFRIELEQEGGARTELWRRQLGAEEIHRYHDQVLDLSPWAGEVVRLNFEAGTADGAAAGEHALLAWGEPVLFGSEIDPRPNVLVILLDTLRADRLGCYGNERGLTPNLDALAARGRRYADASSAASWTLPSHASLFTSTYPSQHGVWSDQVLPAGLPTIAEVLHDAGYRTAAFTEGGFMDTAHGFARGHSAHDARVRDCSETFALATEWITARETPYYAFVHTYQVHSPHDPPAEFRERFVRDYAGELPEVVDSPTYRWGRRGPPPAAADARYVSDLYDAEVAYTDQQVGLLLERLEAAGALDNTLVLVTSDHGEEFFEHGAATHGFSLYQEQLHVPLILHWPGHIEGGGVAEHPVHAVDIAPTLARVAGATVPASFVGTPLERDASAGDRPLFVPMKTLVRSKPERSGEPAASLREGSLKYISFPTDLRPYDKHPAAALFDLERDPQELENLLDARGAVEWERKLEALYERYPGLGSTGSAQYDARIQAELKKLGYAGDED